MTNLPICDIIVNKEMGYILLGNKQGEYNKDMSLSKKALREERKTRKQEKRKMARRIEVISYIKKRFPLQFSSL